MIWADNKNDYERFLSKLFLGGDGGGAGGGGAPAGGESASGGSAPGSGEAGGGVASGGSAGGGPVTGEATAGLPPGADPVSSGDPTSGGFGGTVAGGGVGEGGQSTSESAALGSLIGQAVLAGNMTAEQGNQALAGIGQQNSGISGIVGLASANTTAALAGLPPGLGEALGLISSAPISGMIGLAGLASALAGQGMLGEGEPTGPGAQGGPTAGDPQDPQSASTLGLIAQATQPQEQTKPQQLSFKPRIPQLVESTLRDLAFKSQNKRFI